ncbi:glycosyltransferase [Niabella sp.]|uniref:glycosyltransferase n=1 Tax=Niabella sp. TaxID=1962976 RepID=UPI0026160D52|nr:glycosyltransferase [Niabella sp.]
MHSTNTIPLNQPESKFLVLGTVPPPIGGVTVHVKRLLAHLDKNGISYKFIDINKSSKTTILKACLKYKFIHLHSSNVYLRFLIALLCFVFSKCLISTYHGDLNRYGRFKNRLDRWSVRLTSYPILLNTNSYKIAARLNKNAQLFSAFIPADQVLSLEPSILGQIRGLRKKGFVFCTNAYNVSYDKNNREIYQISDLVTIFNTLPHLSLVISDPSSNYSQLLKKGGINNNILLIPFEHDFNAVLKESDCFIRFTTTDGDSISVKEALSLGVPVIATDVVSRPKGTISISNDLNELLSTLQHFTKTETPDIEMINGAEQLIPLYKNIMYNFNILSK